MSLLSLDIGKKRIGIAISTSGILARIYSTINYQDLDKAIDQIIEILKKEKVEKIVIGLPMLKSGTESDQTVFTRNFAKELRKHTNICFAFVDEYLSSKEAERILKENNDKITKNRREMRGLTDQIAARLILDQYINENNGK